MSTAPKHAVACTACTSCPYRRDVPPGVWDASEYEKLRKFDEPFHLQPTGVFMCHQRNGNLCAGWVAVHGDSLLGLRIAMLYGRVELPIPVIAGDFYASGNEAADAGIAAVAQPPPEAQAMAAKLLKKLPLVINRKNHGRTITTPRQRTARRRKR